MAMYRNHCGKRPENSELNLKFPAGPQILLHSPGPLVLQLCVCVWGGHPSVQVSGPAAVGGHPSVQVFAHHTGKPFENRFDLFTLSF